MGNKPIHFMRYEYAKLYKIYLQFTLRSNTFKRNTNSSIQNRKIFFVGCRTYDIQNETQIYLIVRDTFMHSTLYNTRLRSET